MDLIALRDGVQFVMLHAARFLYHYSLTLLAFVITVAVLLGVEQVSHIVFHLPAVSLASLWTYYGFLVFCFWLFVIVMLSCYILFAVHVTPAAAGTVIDSTRKVLRATWFAVLVAILALVCVALASFDTSLVQDKNLLWWLALGLPIFWLLARGEHTRGRRVLDGAWHLLGAPAGTFPWWTGPVAAGLLVVLVPLFFVLVYGGFGAGWWQAGNGFLGIAIGYCCWIFAGWLHAVSYPAHPARTWTLMQPFGRGLFMLLGANFVGEFIWGLAHWWPAQVSFRNYSIWCIFHLLFSVLLFARLFDWLAYRTLWPMRFLGIVASVVVLYFVSVPAHVGAPAPSTLSKEAKMQTHPWLEAFADRIEQCPVGKPVLVAAASGGGSRAALFAGLVYESLAQQSLDAKHKNSRTWADQVVLISSVSGGSLASAYFGAQTFPVAQPRPIRDWRNSITREIQEWFPQKAKQFREKLESQAAEATEPEVQNSLKVDIEQWKQIEAASDELAMLSDQDLDPAKNRNAWLLKDTFADDMCTDFMAPLLRGLLYPGKERGASVTDFWAGRFPGLGQANRADWPKDRPLLLLNATLVEDGRRLVLGFPPLPAGFLARGQAMMPSLSRLNLDPNLRKNQPIGLQDYQTPYQISLAEAVRLSANFPWGFNPGLLKIEHPQTKYPYLKVVDGGVFDNTGIDTLASVFLSIYQCANDDDAAIKKQGTRVIDALKKRGVLILEIDSGANPGKPSWLARRLSHIFDPVEALEKAGFVNAQNAKLSYFRQLQEVLRDQVTAPPADDKGKKPAKDTTAAMDIIPLWNFFQYHCNHSEDVMTAWAMGPDDKAAVLVQFLFEQQKKQDDLAKTLASITECIAIVQKSRQKDKNFAAAYDQFKKDKATFDVEQKVLSFAAANTKDALRGAAGQADKRAAAMMKAKLPTAAPNQPEAHPAPHLESDTIQRVLDGRMNRVLLEGKKEKR